MTQQAKVAALALPNQQIDFRIEVCRPDGSSYSPKRLFDDSSENAVGWDQGITSTIERGGACKSVVFSGRKDLFACEDANVIRFSVNDGYGWQPAGFGALVTAHTAASLESYGDLIRPYEANAEELLKNVITGTEVYPPQDVAAIARQLVTKYRHPALGYDETLMPNVGVRLDEPSDFAGMTLLKALDELAKKVEEVNGATITYGVQADGKVFFKFPTGEAEIAYDPATFKELPIDLKDLCNAVYWVVGNTPDKQGWTGPYEPGMLAYLSIIDPVKYTQNPRIKGLQPSNPETLFKVKNALATNATGFTSASGGAVVQGAKAYRTGTSGTSVYDIINGTLPQQAPFPSGVSFSYRMDFDVIPAAKVELRYELKNVTSGDTVQGRIFYTLPYSDGAYAPFRAILPPSKELTFNDANSDLNGTYRFMHEYGFHTARILPPNVGTFRVSNVAFQVLNTAALDAAARYEAKTPAQNPATLEPTYDQNGFPEGRFIGNVADILHTGRPDGRKRLPVAETRHTYNKEVRYRCFVDVGNPAREGDEATLERVAAAIENRARESELKLGGRL